MPKVAVPPLPESVTSGQIGRAAGLSERTVNGRKADGRLPVHPDGGIALYPIIKAGVDALATGTGGDLEANRARESRLRGDRLELLNAQLRAELIPADEMEAVVGAAFDAARAKILAVPTAYGPRLAAETDPNAAREMLTKALHDALADLADADIVGAVKERARRLASRPEGGAEADPEDSAAP